MYIDDEEWDRMTIYAADLLEKLEALGEEVMLPFKKEAIAMCYDVINKQDLPLPNKVDWYPKATPPNKKGRYLVFVANSKTRPIHIATYEKRDGCSKPCFYATAGYKAPHIKYWARMPNLPREKLKATVDDLNKEIAEEGHAEQASEMALDAARSLGFLPRKRKEL